MFNSYGIIKKDKKKIVFDILKENLKPKGFKWTLTGLSPEFYLKEENKVYNLGMNFKDSGDIIRSNIGVQFNVVENIMAELAPP